MLLTENTTYFSFITIVWGENSDVSENVQRSRAGLPETEPPCSGSNDLNSLIGFGICTVLAIALVNKDFVERESD